MRRPITINRRVRRLWFLVFLALTGCEIAEFPYYVAEEEPPGEEQPPDDPPLLDIDFLVVRYSWTVADGRDLDTRTAVIRPARAVDVGWNRATNDGPVAAPYLQWGSDNTDIGYEAVLIDIRSLRDDFPEEEEFQLRLRAFWYASRDEGNFLVEFTGYRGGAMEKDGDGFNWVNRGGVEERSIAVMRTATTWTPADIDGDDIGIARYVVATRVLEIIDP